MKISKAVKRDRQIQKRKNGHVSDGRSVFVILEEQKKRAKKIRQERKKKQERLENDVS